MKYTMTNAAVKRMRSSLLATQEAQLSLSYEEVLEALKAEGFGSWAEDQVAKLMNKLKELSAPGRGDGDAGRLAFRLGTLAAEEARFAREELRRVRGALDTLATFLKES